MQNKMMKKVEPKMAKGGMAKKKGYAKGGMAKKPTPCKAGASYKG
jgi:hypothetical protein